MISVATLYRLLTGVTGMPVSIHWVCPICGTRNDLAFGWRCHVCGYNVEGAEHARRLNEQFCDPVRRACHVGAAACVAISAVLLFVLPGYWKCGAVVPLLVALWFWFSRPRRYDEIEVGFWGFLRPW